jgi:hypothetical protein
MKKLINSEYRFSKDINMNNGTEEEIHLTLYIDYIHKTYDIMQDHQEGLMFRGQNSLLGIKINLGYLELAREAVGFAHTELYMPQ